MTSSVMIGQMMQALVLVLVSCFELGLAQESIGPVSREGLLINDGLTAGISLAMLLGILVTFTVTVNVIRYRILKAKE
jgi:hypothetical protein